MGIIVISLSGSITLILVLLNIQFWNINMSKISKIYIELKLGLLYAKVDYLVLNTTRTISQIINKDEIASNFNSASIECGLKAELYT